MQRKQIGHFGGVLWALAIMAAVYLAVALVGGAFVLDREAAAQQPPAGRQVPDAPVVGGTVPGNTKGSLSDTDFWREIRRGVEGQVTIPDRKAGIMIQSEGDNWRAVRNGPLSTWGIWALCGIVALLALFFAVRGRIRIDHGPANRTIERFNGLERFAHWLTAGTFVVLGLTGLNMLYGRYVLPTIMGKEAFAAITLWGKYAHNYLAFGFMAGLALIFVLWVRHNIPNRHDLVWLLKGGGMFMRGVHPPARKFNAGQKILFWLVILGGLSLSLSGIALMFPFQFNMFGETFAAINAVLGTTLPTNLTPIQEMQLSQLWHAVVGLVLMVVIIGHIYIGTVGMEGAFDAMGSGRVDLNWAREHHPLWVEEMREAERGRAAGDD